LDRDAGLRAFGIEDLAGHWRRAVVLGCSVRVCSGEMKCSGIGSRLELHRYIGEASAEVTLANI
jgi:hypothetical protein